MIYTILKYHLFGRAALKEEEERAKRIRRQRAGNRCEITGRKGFLECHHLFDVRRFPFLAGCVWNIRVIAKDIHRGYHSWHGWKADPISFYLYTLKHRVPLLVYMELRIASLVVILLLLLIGAL